MVQGIAEESSPSLPLSKAGTSQGSGSGDPQLTHSLSVGIGAVLIIAALGCLLVIASRRLKLPLATRGAGASLRILASRRPSARLHLVTVEVAPGRAVVIADNGRAIEKLAEIACEAQPAAVVRGSDGHQ